MKLKLIQEEMAQITANRVALADQVDAEQRNYTDDEKERDSQWAERGRKLKDDYDTEVRREEVRSLKSHSVIDTKSNFNVVKPSTADDEMWAFRGWQLAKGEASDKITDRMRVAMDRLGTTPYSDSFVFRSQTKGTAADGGHLTPSVFAGFEKIVTSFGGLRQIAKVLPTPDGNDMDWIVHDNSANTGEQVAEYTGANAAAATPDNKQRALVKKTLKAYRFASLTAPVSVELIEDSRVPFNLLVGDDLAEDIGRLRAGLDINGTGTNEQEGLLAGATVVEAAADDEIDITDITNLTLAMDNYYLQDAALVMNRRTWAHFEDKKDTSGKPINTDSWLVSAKKQIKDVPVIIDDNMPDIAPEAKPIALVARGGILIRDVGQLKIEMLKETYRREGAYGFFAEQRGGSLVVNSKKVFALQMAAAA